MRNANRASQTFAVQTARLSELPLVFSGSSAPGPRPARLRGGTYRKLVLAGGEGGDEAGNFAAGAESLPFSRAESALSRLLSGGCRIPLPATSCAASTV